MNPEDSEFLAELVRLTPSEGWPLGQIILTAADAAQYLGVQPGTLRLWVLRGKITKRGRNEYDMGEIMNMMVESARHAESAS